MHPGPCMPVNGLLHAALLSALSDSGSGSLANKWLQELLAEPRLAQLFYSERSIEDASAITACIRSLDRLTTGRGRAQRVKPPDSTPQQCTPHILTPRTRYSRNSTQQAQIEHPSNITCAPRHTPATQVHSRCCCCSWCSCCMPAAQGVIIFLCCCRCVLFIAPAHRQCFAISRLRARSDQQYARPCRTANPSSPR
jgi:hypothetical protein